MPVYREEEGEQQIGRAYADNNRRHLERYILPYLGEMKLSKINCDRVEAFQMSLIKSSEEGKSLKPKTAKNIVNTLKGMLREPYRLGDIPTNPTMTIGKLGEKTPEMELLSSAEVQQLFDPDRLAAI